MVNKATEEEQKADHQLKARSTSSLRGTPEKAARTLSGGRPQLQRVSSTSSAGSKTSSRHPNSSRRLPAVVVGATAREVLFDHYIKMAQQQSRAPQGYEKPGFLARLFLLLCIPTDLFDFCAFVKLTQRVIVAVARAVVSLSFLLVPLWLLLLWVMAAGGSWQDIFVGLRDWQGLMEAGRSSVDAAQAGGWDWQKLAHGGGMKLAGTLPELQTPAQWLALAKQIWPVALGGLLFFLACDAIDAAVVRREAEKQRGLLKPVHLAPMEQPTSASSRPSLKPSPVPHVPTAQLANKVTANSHTQGSAPASVANSNVKAVTGAQRRVDNPLVREVRSAVIKLEHEVLGNEVTAAVLPQEVLPARVSKLCEEVGLQCNEHPSMEEMAQLVKSVAEQVGVPL